MPVIGFLSGFSPSGSVDVLNSFRQGLGETGHVTPPSVALQPGSAIEVQHDVKIVGRWQRRTNVWRKATNPRAQAELLRSKTPRR